MQKYANYIIFALVVLIVGGVAVSHSRHMKTLVEHLASGNPSLQEAAAVELIRSEQFSDTISGEPAHVRAKAADALQYAGADNSIKPPARKEDIDVRGQAVKQEIALLKDVSGTVRARAVAGLQLMGAAGPSNITELMNGLADTDPYVHQGMVAALTDPHSGIGPQPAVVTAIIGKIKADPPSRSSAGDVLGSALFRSVEGRALSVPQLSELLNARSTTDPKKFLNDAGARSGAADALGKIGDPAAVPVLEDAIANSTEPVHRNAISALGLLASPLGEKALVSAVLSPATDSEARAQAAAGLGKIASDRAVQTLVKLLGDNDSRIRVAATAALGRAARPKIGGPVNERALASLVTALQSKKVTERLGAIGAIEAAAAPQADAPLSQLLKTDREEVKQAAAHALGFPGNSGAVPGLITALNDPSGLVNSAARDALAAIGRPATSALLGVIRSNKPTAAYYASQALARQGRSVMPDLVKVASSPDTKAARWAVSALGDSSLLDKRVRVLLHSLTHSDDPDLAYVAQSQLARIASAPTGG